MQKFNKGDHVMVAKDLGPHMSHFKSDCEAIVIGSYKDKYGGDNTNSYTIHIKGSGQTSWYYEHQLTLIRVRAIDLLDEWKAEQKAFIDQHSDLDWIFENGKDVAKSPSGATLEKLYSMLRDGSMWGRNGEGITWRSHAEAIHRIAYQYLMNNDKQGWIEAAAKFREQDK